MSQLTFEHNGMVMVCGVIKRRDGHVVLTGRVNGEERLRCDMSTTYREHPDKFAREIAAVALNRLRQIDREDQAYRKYGGCTCMGHSECNFCRER